MDWFFGIFDKIVQSMVWRSVIAHIQWVDWATLVFVVIGIVYGAQKGLLRILAEIMEIVFVAFVVFYFYKEFSTKVNIYLEFIPDRVVPVISFILLALPVWFIVYFLDSKVSKIFHTKLSKSISVPGGIIFGAAYLFFVWSFLSQPIILSNYRYVTKAYEPGVSYTGDALRALAPMIHQVPVTTP
jgi:uncharacterized membrane protein required for colicin V production